MPYEVRLPPPRAPLGGSLSSPKPVTVVTTGDRIALDPVTVREILGPSPSADALRTLEAEVSDATAQLDAEIRSGQIGPGPLLVRGRPLGDWLPLQHLARLLRQFDAVRRRNP